MKPIEFEPKNYAENNFIGNDIEIAKQVAREMGIRTEDIPATDFSGHPLSSDYNGLRIYGKNLHDFWKKYNEARNATR